MTNTDIKNLLLVEVFTINPDGEHKQILTEDERKECVSRWREQVENDTEDWDYILKPILDEQKRTKLVSMLEYLSKSGS